MPACGGIEPIRWASISMRIIYGMIKPVSADFLQMGNNLPVTTTATVSPCSILIDVKDSCPMLAFNPVEQYQFIHQPGFFAQFQIYLFQQQPTTHATGYWADPSEYAVDTIAQWDGYYDSAPPFTSGFGFSQLAPDGKIYMTVTATGRFMHIIERPNLPGQACGFRQHGFALPTFNGSTMPHFPNYRLEAIDCN